MQEDKHSLFILFLYFSLQDQRGKGIRTRKESIGEPGRHSVLKCTRVQESWAGHQDVIGDTEKLFFYFTASLFFRCGQATSSGNLSYPDPAIFFTKPA